MTITEALAEIKTIDARIQKKIAFAADHVVRQEAFRDPLAGQGGSRKVVAEHMQSIRDLAEYKLELRAAIRIANEKSELTVDGVSRTVADWLAWRRDVADILRNNLGFLAGKISRSRQEAYKKGGQVSSEEKSSGANPNDIIVNLDELALSGEIEKIEKILGTLDGQLSLFNAVTQISLPMRNVA